MSVELWNMDSSIIKRFFIVWLVFCALLSIYGYAADCIFDLQFALDHINFLPWYFILHLIFQAYIIGPVLFLYFVLFRKIDRALILKMIFLVMAVVLIESYLSPDDSSLYIGKFRRLKQISIYALTALTVVLIDEFYLRSKFGPEKT